MKSSPRVHSSMHDVEWRLFWGFRTFRMMLNSKETEGAKPFGIMNSQEMESEDFILCI